MPITDPSAPIEAHPGEIMRLLRTQAALYDRLETFACKQRTLVSRDDTAPLLSLLADRQKLSLDLQRVAARLEPVRRDWQRHHARLAPAERVEADALLSTIRGRLKRVMERDAEDARVLSGRKQTIGGALRATQATGQALSAYRASGSARSVERLDEAS